jgi:hypothetical protein
MVWFVRFGQGATAGMRTFETQAEAAEYAREMRAWLRFEGRRAPRVTVGWGIDLVE